MVREESFTLAHSSQAGHPSVCCGERTTSVRHIHAPTPTSAAEMGTGRPASRADSSWAMSSRCLQSE